MTWNDGGTSEGWGRSEDPERALMKAVAEGVERRAATRLPATAFRAPAIELAGFIDPRRLVRYEPGQHLAADFPFTDFDARAAKWWLPAHSPLDGSTLPALADCVCSPRAFDALDRQHLFTHATSSGCASGATLQDAFGRALLELVERDAFMRHWFAQAPGLGVDPDTLPEWAALRLRVLAQAGCRAGIQCLTRGAHATWLAWAQHEALHFTSVGAACARDAEEALRSALQEMETVALARLEGVPDVPVWEEQVRGPADHAALYATPAYFRHADRVLHARASARFDLLAPRFGGSIDALVHRLHAAGHEPRCVDLSVPEAATLPGSWAAVTVRALAPGLIPIAFGHGVQPFGMAGEIAAGGRRLHPFP